jgi:hypothetical protein
MGALKLVFFAAVLCIPTALRADEASALCDKHAAPSEFSWNPANQLVTPQLSRFYAVGESMASAYLAGNDDQVNSLAREYLELATIYRCNWNYGNAVHDANRYLGLVSLRSGSVNQAAAYLELSGKTPGSPQLDTFGPELDLANGLLKRGQVEAVKQYLMDIKIFWKSDNGQVDRWLAAIARGERPTLDRFSAVTDGPWITAFQIVGWAWPELIVLTFLYVKRKRIARRLLFVVVGSAISYATCFLAGEALAFVIGKAALFFIGNHSQITYYISVSLMGLVAFVALPIWAVFALTKFCSRKNELKAG